MKIQTQTDNNIYPMSAPTMAMAATVVIVVAAIGMATVRLREDSARAGLVHTIWHEEA